MDVRNIYITKSGARVYNMRIKNKIIENWVCKKIKAF